MSNRSLLVNKSTYLNAALELFCLKLQLPQQQFELARSTYGDVGKWLAAPDSILHAHSPHIFHQGSMLLETTVKPYKQVQFDLDAVCCLRDAANLTPRQVYEMVYKRMRQSAAYKENVTPKDRCIRLAVSASFHIDVVPAVVVAGGPENGIRIPNATVQTASWKDSHPKGYHKWFEVQCKKVKDDGVRKFAMNMSEARIDPMPDREPYRVKKVLKRAVQLIKRWRDHKFHGREEIATPSIVVTTLAAEHYDGEQNLTVAVGLIMEAIQARLAKGKPRLYNPAHPVELISEKWEKVPGSFEAFRDAVDAFVVKWAALAGTSGVHNIGAILTDLFGDTFAESLAEAFSDIDRAKQDGTLLTSAATRTLIPAAAVVSTAGAAKANPRHTFFGN